MSRSTWTPRDPLWHQIWQAWRQGGWRRVWQRARPQLAMSVWGSSVFLEFVIPLQAQPKGSGDSGVARAGSTEPEWIGELPPEELPALKPVTSRAMYRHFQALQRQGAFCYAAKVNGAVVAYNWYTTGPYRSVATSLQFPPRPGEAVLIYSHTARAWRGRGVDYRLKWFAATALQRRGVDAVRTTMMESNRAAVRTALRWHGRLVERHRVERRLWWRRIRSDTPLVTTQEACHGIA